MRKKPICDGNCFECIYEDCVALDKSIRNFDRLGIYGKTVNGYILKPAGEKSKREHTKGRERK